MKKHKFITIAVLLFCTLVILFLIYWLLGANTDLTVAAYSLSSKKVSAPVRFAVIADLHSCDYGEGQTELLDAIAAQKPDAVLLVGDIFDEKMPDERAETFLRVVGRSYPCYYVSGNHEYRKAETRSMEEIYRFIESCGISVLCGDSVTAEINGVPVNICGLPGNQMDRYRDSGFLWDAALDKLGKTADNGHYTVLLSHMPYLIEEYLKGDYDLILCGHAHGGQWRVPGVLNGIFAPGEGFFPKYAGGEYGFGSTTMIVSRGLSRENSIIPRIFNPPELVIVEIVPETNSPE